MPDERLGVRCINVVKWITIAMKRWNGHVYPKSYVAVLIIF